jgi:hypothetical protein
MGGLNANIGHVLCRRSVESRARASKTGRSYEVKIRTWKVGIAALALSASPALSHGSGMTMDEALANVAYASDCCESTSCCDGVGCGDACAAPSALACACPAAGALEGFSLANAIGLGANSPWIIGGWSQWGYHNRNDGVFNTHPHHFDAQQQWLYLGRNANGANGLDIGGRVDLLYGTDASNTQSFGNPPGTFDYQNGWDHGVYGWALPQAYLEAAYGDLSVKVGHFWTLLGYQVVPATGNFFYSIPYTFNFGEAFTHTGALSTYKASDRLTLYNGWTLGWDTGYDQLNSGNSYLGGFAYTLTDDVTFTYIVTYGNLGWRDAGSKNSYVHSCVLVANLTDNLQYVGQSDMMRTDNPGVSQLDTIGLNQYLFYSLTDTLKAGTRVEWWKANGQSIYEMAYGLNIRPIKNLVFRPEVRYNWAPSGVGQMSEFLPVTSPPIYSVGNETQASDYINNTIFGMDMVYSF